MKKSIFDANLLEGPIFRNLMLFAIPLLISSVFQSLYNTVDTMIVGNVLGDVSLAAIGSSSTIYNLLVGFALGVGNGLAIVTARSYGSKDIQLLKKSVAACIVIGFGISALITVLGEVTLYPLLEILNTPAEIIVEAYGYVSTIVMFTLVLFIYNLCAGLLRAIGNSVMPLVFLVFSSVINIGLDLLFIIQFGLGVKGAAIATVISQGIAAFFCLIYISKKTTILIPAKEHFVMDKALYKEMLGQGFSMGFMGSIVSLGTVILQYGINGLGTSIIAGHTAARKLFALFNLPFMSLSMAISTFVSQNCGANQIDRIKSAMKSCYVFDFFSAVVISVFLFIFSEDLVHMISGSVDPVVISNGALYMKIVGPFYFVLGILMQSRFALQGLGAKLIPLVSSVIELVGKIIFAFILIAKFGYIAVIFCEPVIWVFMTIQLVYALYTNPKMKNS